MCVESQLKYRNCDSLNKCNYGDMHEVCNRCHKRTAITSALLQLKYYSSLLLKYVSTYCKSVRISECRRCLLEKIVKLYVFEQFCKRSLNVTCNYYSSLRRGKKFRISLLFAKKKYLHLSNKVLQKERGRKDVSILRLCK